MKSDLPLLLDCLGTFRQIGKPKLVESSTATGRKCLRVEGVFQNYEVTNANRRQYPKGIWESALKEGSDFATRLASRNVLGMIEHPEDGITRLGECSHVITEVRFATEREIGQSAGDLEKGDIIGAYETLQTPQGKVLESLLLSEVQFGVSSRGNGTVTEQGERHVVNEDYELETWDVVFSPSVTRALPKMVGESSRPDKVLETVSHLDKKLDEGGTAKAIQPEEEAEPMPASATRPKTESSFVLATGVMNNGQQLIPVQLIAESDMSQFRWVNALNKQSIEGLHIYENIENALSGLKSFCESNGRAFDMPLLGNIPSGQSVAGGGDKQTTTESKDKNATTMTPLQEMRRANADVIRLRQTNVKRLKPSDKVAFFEQVSDFRQHLGQLTEKDGSLLNEAAKILTNLKEFEDELDTAPAPAPEAGPEMDPEAGGEELPDEGQTDPTEVADTLDQAAEKIDELTGGNDPEAADIADELRDISAELAPGGAEDEFGDGEDEFGEEPVDGGGSEEFPMESRARRQKRIRESKNRRKPRLRNRTERKLALTTSRYNRLREASAKLFERFKALTSSSAPLGEGATDLQERAQRMEEAARELAGRYNRDMMEMASEVMRLKRPDIWEKYGSRLLKTRTFDEFFRHSSRLIENAPAPAMESDCDDDDDDSKNESKPKTALKKTLAEGEKPADGKDKEPITESSHSALSMVLRARKHMNDPRV